MAADAENSSKEKLFKFGDYVWIILFILLGTLLITGVFLLLGVWKTPPIMRQYFEL